LAQAVSALVDVQVEDVEVQETGVFFQVGLLVIFVDYVSFPVIVFFLVVDVTACFDQEFEPNLSIFVEIAEVFVTEIFHEVDLKWVKIGLKKAKMGLKLQNKAKN
jgi:hypothetical protein